MVHQKQKPPDSTFVEFEIVESTNFVVVENPTMQSANVESVENVEKPTTTIIYANVENPTTYSYSFDNSTKVVIYKIALVGITIVGIYLIVEIVELIIVKIVRIADAIAAVALNFLKAAISTATVYALYKVIRHSSSSAKDKTTNNATTTHKQHSTNQTIIINNNVEIKNRI